MVSKYCVCLVFKNPRGNPLGEGGYNVHDAMVFNNPDKDPEAKAKCLERAAALRKAGNTKVQPVIITGIPDEVAA